MKKILLTSALVVLIFSLLSPVLVFATETKEIKEDPFKYFAESSLDKIMYYISRGKDKEYRSFSTKEMSFSVAGPELISSSAVDYGEIHINTASGFTLNFDGSPTKIPFSTSRIVYQDDEWGRRIEEINGHIVIKTEITGGNLPSGKFTAYFVGNIYREFRLGPTDNELDIYDIDYTEKNPYKVSVYYKMVTGGEEINASDDSYRIVTFSLRSYAHGESFFRFYAYPKEIVLLSADMPKSDKVVDTTADDSPGESVGIPVATAIVLGAFGALGAAGVLGAAGIGTAELEKKKEESKSNFEMVLHKDFGNKIRYGAPAVTVSAKMVEIKPDGSKINRNDLTSKIEIFSEDEVLNVSPASLTSEYMSSLVTAEASNSKPENAVISFRFIGKGGRFQNNVTFDLIDEPYISFPEQKTYSGIMFLEAIAGDGFTYQVNFELSDFALDADTIELKTEDTDLILDYEKISLYNYNAIITNNTAAIEGGPFAKGRNIEVVISASNKDEKAENTFTIMLYPEGLSVKGRVEEDYFIVDTAENKGGGIMDPSIKPARLDIKLALKATDEKGRPKAHITSEGITLKKLEATSGQTETLLSAFKYELNHELGKEGIFYIEPSVTLPESKSKYYVTLPIEGSYKDENYNMELPVRLLGVRPEKPETWQKEHDKLVRDVQRFGLTSGGRAQQLIRASKNRTPFELSMIRRALIEEGVEYYQNEATEFNKLADKLENLEAVANVIKWFGDQATSYLLTIYVGPTAEAFISPFKDYLLELIGEAGARIYWGEEIDFNGLGFMSSLASGVENQLGNIITGEDPPTPKKIAALVAGLALLNFSKHYLFEEETKEDFCKSVIATGEDMTVNAFKILLSSKMDSMLKNDAFKEKLEGFIGNYISTGAESFFKDAQGKLGQAIHSKTQDVASSNILKKYIEESFGFAVSTVYKNITEREKDQSFSAIRIPFGTYTIEIDPLANMTVVVEAVFDYLNSILSFIPSKSQAMPEYPIYYT